jgi:ankyrin repeat protein
MNKRYRFFSSVLFFCLLLFLFFVQCKTLKVNLYPPILDFDIHKAAEEGNLEKVKAFLDKNPQLVHSTDENGRTPLIYAVAGGHKDLVEFLLSKGAALDPKYVNGSGGTLLHMAATSGLKDLCGRLIESDFDVDAKDRYGLTPMHMAALSNHKEVADLLISKGACLNAQSESGWTPLRFAEEVNHVELVEFLVSKGASREEIGWIDIEGEYFGQTGASFTPQLFSSGIVSSIFLEHSPVEFSPDAKEAYWTSDFRDFGPTEGKVYFSRQVEGRWTSPQIAPFSKKLNCYNPVISYDGNKLYFFAALPTEDPEEHVPNIFVVARKKEGWSEPQIVEIPNIRGYLMTQFSVARDGTLYYAINPEDDEKSWDIYRSRLVKGHYTEPESLGGSINTPYWDSYPYIDREQRYMIFTSMGRPDSFGGMDLYISFRKDDDSWAEAINMGDEINSNSVDTFANVSPDGKWLFFVSGRNGNVDVYWVDAKIIEELKSDIMK